MTSAKFTKFLIKDIKAFKDLNGGNYMESGVVCVNPDQTAGLTRIKKLGAVLSASGSLLRHALR